MPRARFAKISRLSGQEAFGAVFRGPSFKVSHPTYLILAKTNRLNYSRLGLVVAKKHLKKAVDRNDLKRRVREVFRCNTGEPAIDVVFLARSGMCELRNDEVNSALQRAWVRLIEKFERVRSVDE